MISAQTKILSSCSVFYKCNLLAIFLLIAACNRQEKSTDYSDYVRKTLYIADSINAAATEPTFRYVDSVFNAYHHPSIKDLFRKYEFKERIYIFHHKYTPATIYADSMLWIIRDHIDEKDFLKEYMKALFAKGLVLELEGNYSQSLEYYYKGRQVIEKSNDTCGLSEFTSMLGYIKYKQKKYLDAARFGILAYHEALSCPDNYNKYTSLQGKLDNIAIYYTRALMPDSALYYYNEALNSVRQNGNKLPDAAAQRYFEMAKGIIYGNMADAWYQKGDTAAAEELLKQSIFINNKKGFDRADAQLTMAKLARLYLTRKQLSRAEEVLLQFRKVLDSIPNRVIELKWYELQMEYYASAGQKEAAYDYARLYLKNKDSLTEVQQPQMDLDKEYELIKSHYDLILSEKKNEFKTFYLVVTLIVTVLAITIASLLWLYWTRSRKLNRRITRQNNQMQLAVSSIEESQKENTRIMNIVAHDLRNPVTSVISITSILLESDSLSAEDKEMLVMMQNTSQQSLEMIADLLNVNTTAENMKKAPVAVHTLLHYCVNMLQYKAAEKQQRISIEEEYPITLNINRDKMWRVFSNLIVNAIKFSPEKSTITVRMRKTHDSIIISVQDYGIGIPNDLKDKVFDMFGNAKRPGTSGEQSFGLGLHISKQIVLAHNGKIWLESEEGIGSTFIISLPAN